jgi:hypothetical protein
LEKLYKDELDAGKDDNKKAETKKTKDTEKLYQENKDSIDKEFNRIKSIVADLDFGSTILESDYRNIFYQFNNVIQFLS